MKHLRRAAAVLVALLFITLVLPRLVPPVESIQQFGFYRGGNAAQEWASLPVSFVDSSSCRSCHQPKYDSWSQADHQTVVCETCHGPGKDHLNVQAKMTVDTSSDLCSACHQQLASRPESFPQVDVSQHAGTAACSTCHNPHQPAIAQAAKTIPHSLEGRTGCLSGCHNPGGLKPVPETHTGRAQDSCQSCHKTEAKT